MKKAVYFDILNYHEDNLALLHEHFRVISLPNPSFLNEDVLREVELVFAPLGFYFGDDFFFKAPRLKVIASNTTGVPHIDVHGAANRNIQVFSLRGERDFLTSITPTAELTIGLMIALTRNLIPARDSVLSGKWSRWDFGGPKMLSRMSLGIVGLGRLGSMVAGIASQMGMEVSYYDPYVEGSPYDHGKKDHLEELVEGSDVVSIHVDLNEETKGMFSASLLERFKWGGYLINTARGEVIDSEALIRALETGRIGGAALDVLDGEFDEAFQKGRPHPLIQYAKTHSNVIITPHIAGSTEDAWVLTQRFVIDRSIAFFDTFPGEK
jgi:phosphoglycerate dehydrogenase-like enzyme